MQSSSMTTVARIWQTLPLGTKCGDIKKGAGYLSPAHVRERGSSPTSWVCLKQESEGEGSQELPDAKCTPMLPS